MFRNYILDLMRIKSNKKENVVFAIFFFIVCFSSIFSIVTQAPFFINNGFEKITLLLWGLVIFVAFVIDYKSTITYFIFPFLLLLPFFLYCLVSLLFGVNYFDASLTRYFLFACALLSLGSFIKKNYRSNHVRFLLFVFALSCIFMSLFLFISIILPSFSSVTENTYLYTSKNATLPILASGAIVLIFSSNKKFLRIISQLFFIFIFFLCFVAKCRTVLISLFIVFFYLVYKFNGKKTFFITLLVLITILLFIIFIPYLNDVLIKKILFNNKTDIDSIFSGRLSLVVEALGNINFFKGKPSFYVDCMIVLLLCNFGILGLILVVPFLIHPFLIYRHFYDKTLKQLLLSLILLFVINSLFEGFGFFGPGNKVLILWLVLGLGLPQAVSYYKETYFKKISFYEKNVNKIKPALCFSILNICFYSITLFFSFNSSSANNIIEPVYSKIVDSSSNNDYRYVESVSFDDKNRTVFCVGQKYEFKLNVFPEDAVDKAIHPLVWNGGDESIVFDKNTNKATFLKPVHSGIQFYSEKVHKVGCVAYVNILDEKSFPFDEIVLSTNQGDNLSLFKGQCSMIEYNHDYIPSIDCLKFVSSDESVARVDDDGRIVAVGTGTAAIKAIGSNNKSDKYSNELIVHVNNSEMIKPTSIDVCFDNDHFYTNTDYSLSVEFNDDIHDDYLVYIDDKYVGTNLKTISFEHSGKNNVVISAVSNKKVFKATNFLVDELVPIKFVDDGLLWVALSNAPIKLNLQLEYNDGTIRDVVSNDLLYTYENTENRASKVSNGIIGNDALTFYTVKTGYVNLHFVSAINENIDYTLKIKVSTKSYTDYFYGLEYTSTILLVSLCFIGFIPLFLYPIKKEIMVANFLINIAVIAFVIFWKKTFLLLPLYLVILILCSLAAYFFAKKKGTVLKCNNFSFEKTEKKGIIYVKI